jgi:NADH-quinone oxidoreductase subunit K
VIHLWLPMVLAAVLAGAGTYGVLARRNAVLVLIGVELILNAANVMLVALGARDTAPAAGSLQTGQALTLFVITIAAAEICVALAVVLTMFRLQGHIDLTRVPELGEPTTDPDADIDTDTDPDRSTRASQSAPGAGR